jgi:hypothetical protein
VCGRTHPNCNLNWFNLSQRQLVQKVEPFRVFVRGPNDSNNLSLIITARSIKKYMKMVVHISCSCFQANENSSECKYEFTIISQDLYYSKQSNNVIIILEKLRIFRAACIVYNYRM